MSVLELTPEAKPVACNATAEWRIDDAQRRIFVSLQGPLNGRQACLEICRAFLTRPDAVTYDMLYDIRGYEGDVEPDDVQLIVAVYAECKPDTSVPCRTAFATPDKNFEFWAAAMNQQFPGRTHRAFPRLADATAWLNEPLATRKA